MNKIKKIASFLRLVDENGQLSLTNVSVIVTIIKLVLVQNASVCDLGILIASLTSYQVKRIVTKKPLEPSALEERVEAMASDFEAAKSKLNVLTMQVGIKNRQL